LGEVILLIEDDEDDIELIRSAFHTCEPDLEIVVAQTAEAALAVVASDVGDTIRLILLDLSLPGVRGHDLLPRLRDNPTTRLAPIVVLSGSSSPNDMELALERGANAYLTKPELFDELVELVGSAARFWLELARVPPKT
jgi:CheY-like chemotaxis protein